MHNFIIKPSNKILNTISKTKDVNYFKKIINLWITILIFNNNLNAYYCITSEQNIRKIII